MASRFSKESDRRRRREEREESRSQYVHPSDVARISPRPIPQSPIDYRAGGPSKLDHSHAVSPTSSFSSNSSYLDISRTFPPERPRGLGAIRTFFTAPSEHRFRLRRRRSRRVFGGVGLSHINSSSSSLNSDLAYGTGFIKVHKRRRRVCKVGREEEDRSDRSGRNSRISSRSEKKKRNAPEIGSDAAIVALGVGLAAAARKQNKQDLRDSRRAEFSTSINQSTVSWKGSEGARGLGASRSSREDTDDEGWESASDEESEAYSVDSVLAYGHDDVVASGAGGWGWGGITPKVVRHPRSSVVDPALFGPQNSLTGYVHEPVGFESVNPDNSAPLPTVADLERLQQESYHNGSYHYESYRDESVVSNDTSRSLQQVYPVPTSDPSRFDVMRSSGSGVDRERYPSTRPNPVPIQQPQPIVPVSQKVYDNPIYSTQSEPIITKKDRPSKSGSIAGAALAGVAITAIGASIAAERRDNRERERDDERAREDREKRVGEEYVSKPYSKPAFDPRDDDRQRRREKRREERRNDNAEEVESREERKERRRKEDEIKYPNETREQRRERRRYEREHPDADDDKRRDDREQETLIEAPLDPPISLRGSRRDERREERRSAGRDEPEPISIRTNVDPFQYQVADDAFESPHPHREPETFFDPSIHIVTVDREPSFVSRNRSSSMKEEHGAHDEPMSTSDEYIGHFREANHIENDISHFTAPIAIGAITAAVAAIAAEDKKRHSRRLSRDKADRRRAYGMPSEAERDYVQEEADRVYREQVLARKLASELEEDHEESASPIARIVTPPGYHEDKKKGPFDAPNADFRLDKIMTPIEFKHFSPPADQVVFRESDRLSLRPLLTLTQPTPSHTPIPEKQETVYSSNSDHEHASQTSSVPEAVIGPKGNVIYNQSVHTYNPSTPSTPKAVTWGENETKHFDVESPDQTRTEYFSSPDTRDVEEGDRRGDAPSSDSTSWGTVAAVVAGAAASAAALRDKVTLRSDESDIPKGAEKREDGRAVDVKNQSDQSSDNRGSDLQKSSTRSGRSRSNSTHGEPETGRDRGLPHVVTPKAERSRSHDLDSQHEIRRHDSVEQHPIRAKSPEPPFEYRAGEATPRSSKFRSVNAAPPVIGPKPFYSPNMAPSPHIPGAFDDDLEFTATLAAGLQDSGFDPDIVINDPVYRRRTSPPGSSTSSFYQTPFVETISDLGVLAPTQPTSDMVAGEVLETPYEDALEEIETPQKRSKKEQRKREKTAKRQSSESNTGTPIGKTTNIRAVEEPESYFESPKSSEREKKSKKSKRDSYNWDDEAEIPTSTVTVPVDAFDDLRGDFTPKNVDEDEERVFSKKRKGSKLKRDSTDPASVPLPTTSEISRYDEEFETGSKNSFRRESARHESLPEIEPANIPLPDTSEVSRYEDTHETPERPVSEHAGGKHGSPSSREPADIPLPQASDISKYEDEELRPRPSRRSSSKHSERTSSRAPSTSSRASTRHHGEDEDDARRAKRKAKEKEKEKEKENDKDKKSGGFFGLFSSSSSKSESRAEPTRSNSTESRYEDIEDSKKKSKKSRRSSLADGSEVYGSVGSQSIQDLSVREDKSDKDQDQHDKPSRRRSSSRSSPNGNKIHGENERGPREDSFLAKTGILGVGAGLAGAMVVSASQHQHSNADVAVDDDQQRKNKDISTTPPDSHTESQRPEKMPRRDTINDPEISEREFRPSIDPQYGDLLPLPPSTPRSLDPKVETEIPSLKLPDSRPNSPQDNLLVRERPHRPSIIVRRQDTHTPLKSPSQSAIPLKFMMGRPNPTSPRLIRGSPATDSSTLSSPELMAPLRFRGRPTSWETTKEFQPLFLVNKSRRGSNVNDAEAEKEQARSMSDKPVRLEHTSRPRSLSPSTPKKRVHRRSVSDALVGGAGSAIALAASTLAAALSKVESQSDTGAALEDKTGEPVLVESDTKDRSSFLFEETPPATASMDRQQSFSHIALRSIDEDVLVPTSIDEANESRKSDVAETGPTGTELDVAITVPLPVTPIENVVETDVATSQDGQQQNLTAELAPAERSEVYSQEQISETPNVAADPEDEFPEFVTSKKSKKDKKKKNRLTKSGTEDIHDFGLAASTMAIGGLVGAAVVTALKQGGNHEYDAEPIEIAATNLSEDLAQEPSTPMKKIENPSPAKQSKKEKRKSRKTKSTTNWDVERDRDEIIETNESDVLPNTPIVADPTLPANLQSAMAYEERDSSSMPLLADTSLPANILSALSEEKKTTTESTFQAGLSDLRLDESPLDCEGDHQSALPIMADPALPSNVLYMMGQSDDIATPGIDVDTRTDRSLTGEHGKDTEAVGQTPANETSAECDIGPNTTVGLISLDTPSTSNIVASVVEEPQDLTSIKSIEKDKKGDKKNKRRSSQPWDEGASQGTEDTGTLNSQAKSEEREHDVNVIITQEQEVDTQMDDIFEARTRKDQGDLPPDEIPLPPDESSIPEVKLISESVSKEVEPNVAADTADTNVPPHTIAGREDLTRPERSVVEDNLATPAEVPSPEQFIGKKSKKDKKDKKDKNKKNQPWQSWEDETAQSTENAKEPTWSPASIALPLETPTEQAVEAFDQSPPQEIFSTPAEEPTEDFFTSKKSKKDKKKKNRASASLEKGTVQFPDDVQAAADLSVATPVAEQELEPSVLPTTESSTRDSFSAPLKEAVEKLFPAKRSNVGAKHDHISMSGEDDRLLELGTIPLPADTPGEIEDLQLEEHTSMKEADHIEVQNSGGDVSHKASGMLAVVAGAASSALAAVGLVSAADHSNIQSETTSHATKKDASHVVDDQKNLTNANILDLEPAAVPLPEETRDEQQETFIAQDPVPVLYQSGIDATIPTTSKKSKKDKKKKHRTTMSWDDETQLEDQINEPGVVPILPSIKDQEKRVDPECEASAVEESLSELHIPTEVALPLKKSNRDKRKNRRSQAWDDDDNAEIETTEAGTIKPENSLLPVETPGEDLPTEPFTEVQRDTELSSIPTDSTVTTNDLALVTDQKSTRRDMGDTQSENSARPTIGHFPSTEQAISPEEVSLPAAILEKHAPEEISLPAEIPSEDLLDAEFEWPSMKKSKKDKKKSKKSKLAQDEEPSEPIVNDTRDPHVPASSHSQPIPDVLDEMEEHPFSKNGKDMSTGDISTERREQPVNKEPASPIPSDGHVDKPPAKTADDETPGFIRTLSKKDKKKNKKNLMIWDFGNKEIASENDDELVKAQEQASETALPDTNDADLIPSNNLTAPQRETTLHVDQEASATPIATEQFETARTEFSHDGYFPSGNFTQVSQRSESPTKRQDQRSLSIPSIVAPVAAVGAALRIHSRSRSPGSEKEGKLVGKLGKLAQMFDNGEKAPMGPEEAARERSRLAAYQIAYKPAGSASGYYAGMPKSPSTSPYLAANDPTDIPSSPITPPFARLDSPQRDTERVESPLMDIQAVDTLPKGISEDQLELARQMRSDFETANKKNKKGKKGAKSSSRKMSDANPPPKTSDEQAGSATEDVVTVIQNDAVVDALTESPAPDGLIAGYKAEQLELARQMREEFAMASPKKSKKGKKEKRSSSLTPLEHDAKTDYFDSQSSAAVADTKKTSVLSLSVNAESSIPAPDISRAGYSSGQLELARQMKEDFASKANKAKKGKKSKHTSSESYADIDSMPDSTDEIISTGEKHSSTSLDVEPIPVGNTDAPDGFSAGYKTDQLELARQMREEFAQASTKKSKKDKKRGSLLRSVTDDNFLVSASEGPSRSASEWEGSTGPQIEVAEPFPFETKKSKKDKKGKNREETLAFLEDIIGTTPVSDSVTPPSNIVEQETFEFPTKKSKKEKKKAKRGSVSADADAVNTESDAPALEVGSSKTSKPSAVDPTDGGVNETASEMNDQGTSELADVNRLVDETVFPGNVPLALPSGIARNEEHSYKLTEHERPSSSIINAKKDEQLFSDRDQSIEEESEQNDNKGTFAYFADDTPTIAPAVDRKPERGLTSTGTWSFSNLNNLVDDTVLPKSTSDGPVNAVEGAGITEPEPRIPQKDEKKKKPSSLGSSEAVDDVNSESKVQHEQIAQGGAQRSTEHTTQVSTVQDPKIEDVTAEDGAFLASLSKKSKKKKGKLNVLDLIKNEAVLAGSAPEISQSPTSEMAHNNLLGQIERSVKDNIQSEEGERSQLDLPISKKAAKSRKKVGKIGALMNLFESSPAEPAKQDVNSELIQQKATTSWADEAADEQDAKDSKISEEETVQETKSDGGSAKITSSILDMAAGAAAATTAALGLTTVFGYGRADLKEEELPSPGSSSPNGKRQPSDDPPVPTKTSKKDKRRKVRDRRSTAEDDLFDDPALWEGAKPSSFEEVGEKHERFSERQQAHGKTEGESDQRKTGGARETSVEISIKDWEEHDQRKSDKPTESRHESGEIGTTERLPDDVSQVNRSTEVYHERASPQDGNDESLDTIKASSHSGDDVSRKHRHAEVYQEPLVPEKIPDNSTPDHEATEMYGHSAATVEFRKDTFKTRSSEVYQNFDGTKRTRESGENISTTPTYQETGSSHEPFGRSQLVDSDSASGKQRKGVELEHSTTIIPVKEWLSTSTHNDLRTKDKQLPVPEHEASIAKSPKSSSSKSSKDGKKSKKGRPVDWEVPSTPTEETISSRDENRIVLPEVSQSESLIHQPVDPLDDLMSRPSSKKGKKISKGHVQEWEAPISTLESSRSPAEKPFFRKEMDLAVPALHTPSEKVGSHDSRYSSLVALPVVIEEQSPRVFDTFSTKRDNIVDDRNRDSGMVDDSPGTYAKGLPDLEPIRDSGVYSRDASPPAAGHRAHGSPIIHQHSNHMGAETSVKDHELKDETSSNRLHRSPSIHGRRRSPANEASVPLPQAPKYHANAAIPIGLAAVGAAGIAAATWISPGPVGGSDLSVRKQRTSSFTSPSVHSLRSASRTPPLRRSDRQISGDARSLSQQNPSKDPERDNIKDGAGASTVSLSDSNPIANEGRVRAKEMTDVYDGYGEGRIGSPRSPTRPHSMRRRQSMQVLDLEARLDHMAAENRMLAEAKQEAENKLVRARPNSNALAEKDAELDSLKTTLDWLHKEVERLKEVNDGLQSANETLADRHTQLETQHNQRGVELQETREAQGEFAEKDREISQLRRELDSAQATIRSMQQRILMSKASDTSFLTVRDEDYFDNACQELCQHVQQWVLRFSKFSDMRACRLTSEINNDKIVDRLDNAVLDGSDVDAYLSDRVKRRDIFMSMTMTMIWEFVFTRYLFGMDREQRQKLKSLEKILSEVGPPAAVHQWRAITLTLLSKRESYAAQREQDTEAVVQMIFQTLSEILPPPSQLEGQIQDQLRRVMRTAVDLSIEMRTQRAEYMMLPPLQPEYDANGDLARQVAFNAALMNERSGDTISNEDLEAQNAIVRIVLFPLVVKRGDDEGAGEEEIVVCPAQVLIVKPNNKHVRISSGAAGASRISMQSSMPDRDENMI